MVLGCLALLGFSCEGAVAAVRPLFSTSPAHPAPVPAPGAPMGRDTDYPSALGNVVDDAFMGIGNITAALIAGAEAEQAYGDESRRLQAVEVGGRAENTSAAAEEEDPAVLNLAQRVQDITV
eukprot:g10833.t1